MGRKVVILTMIAVLFSGTIIPTRTHAALGAIGGAIVREGIKHVTKSQMVRTGVKASSRSALERAHQAWFSRFTAEQIAAMEAAAARAVPANTPGWLKVTIGASLWLTGLDIALDIWDMIQGNEEVVYPVEEGTEGDRTVVSKMGLVPYIYPNPQERISPGGYRYPPGTSGWARIYTPLGWFPMRFDPYGTPITEEHWMNDSFNYVWGVKIKEFDISEPNSYQFSLGIVYEDGLSPKQQKTHSMLISKALLEKFRGSEELTYVSDPLTGVTYVPTLQPNYVPNPYPDLFPQDTQAVEVLVPDPSYWPNVDEAIWQNRDYIREDVTEPVTDPQPDPTPGQPDWGDMTPPSAPDWADRLHGVVSTRFPFSLPWDLYRVLSLFAAEPERPHIRIDENYMGMPFRFEVDFSFLDPYMPFFRGVIVVGFCVGLILITRKIMGGGT